MDDEITMQRTLERMREHERWWRDHQRRVRRRRRKEMWQALARWITGRA